MRGATVLLPALCAGMRAQTTERQVSQALEPALMTPELAVQQLREYLAARALPPRRKGPGRHGMPPTKPLDLRLRMRLIRTPTWRHL